MNDLDGQTWVAFSDLSGLKALYEKKPEDAANALDKFYNTVYEIQEERNPIIVANVPIFRSFDFSSDILLIPVHYFFASALFLPHDHFPKAILLFSHN